jgi:hypothetical protein
MKNTIIIILMFLATIVVKAQSPIIDFEDYKPVTLTGNSRVNGAYYKDTKNQLNAFEGNYIYTNGTTTLKIVLKKMMSTVPTNLYYEDIIIGEYQYIENGIEKVNTFSKFNITSPFKGTFHTISGNLLLTGTQLGCPDCATSEKRLNVGFVDTPSHSNSRPQIRIITSGGKSAIKFSFHWETRAHKEGDPPLTSPILPSGEYILIKQ